MAIEFTCSTDLPVMVYNAKCKKTTTHKQKIACKDAFWLIESQVDEEDTFPFGVLIHLFCPLLTTSVLICSRG